MIFVVVVVFQNFLKKLNKNCTNQNDAVNLCKKKKKKKFYLIVFFFKIFKLNGPKDVQSDQVRFCNCFVIN